MLSSGQPLQLSHMRNAMQDVVQLLWWRSVVIFLPARTSAPTSDGFHDCDIRIASPPCLHKRYFTPHGTVAMIWSSKSTGSSSGSLNTLSPRMSLLGLKRRVEDTLNYSYFLITQLSALPTLSFLFFFGQESTPPVFAQQSLHYPRTWLLIKAKAMDGSLKPS